MRNNGWEAEVKMGGEKTGKLQRALGHCHHERSEVVSRMVGGLLHFVRNDRFF